MPGKLVEAFYDSKDVKSLIQSEIDAGNKYFTVSNSNLNGDPRPGVYKYLTLQYDEDNVRTTRSAGEGQEIYISEKSTIKFPTKLFAAFYDSKDVKSLIQGKIDAGNNFLTVSNDNLGGDPRVGVYKYLTLQYDVEGIRTTRSAGEGQQIWLSL